MIDVYDVAIIGMGAVGTATGFLLAEFTNVQSLLFLEKENSVGRIASDRRTNSQTRHPFGGELNYTPEVMKAIKRYSDMIPSYANSEYGRGYDILRRTRSGMVLAVGKNEKEYRRIKFNTKVEQIEHVPDCYDLRTKNGEGFSARYVVVSAGSYTLSLAKQLGLGGDYVAFPVAGKFFTSKPVINGKVYTFQEEGVPF